MALSASHSTSSLVIAQARDDLRRHEREALALTNLRRSKPGAATSTLVAATRSVVRPAGWSSKGGFMSHGTAPLPDKRERAQHAIRSVISKDLFARFRPHIASSARLGELVESAVEAFIATHPDGGIAMSDLKALERIVESMARESGAWVDAPAPSASAADSSSSSSSSPSSAAAAATTTTTTTLRGSRSTGALPASRSSTSRATVPPSSPIKAPGDGRGGSRGGDASAGSDPLGTTTAAARSMSTEDLAAYLVPRTEGAVVGGWAASPAYKGKVAGVSEDGFAPKILVIGGRMKHHYTWEEEGDWQVLAKFQQARAVADAEAEKERRRAMLSEYRKGLGAQVESISAIRHHEAEATRAEEEAALRASEEAKKAAEAEAEARRAKAARIKAERAEQLAELELRKAAEKEAYKRFEEERARQTAAALAADKERQAAARKAEKERLISFFHENEASLRARAELHAKEREEDVKMMKAYAEELEKQERARRAMFDGLAKREQAILGNQKAVFEARAAEERALEERIATFERKRREDDERKAREKEEARKRTKEEIRKSVEMQLALKEEERRREAAELDKMGAISRQLAEDARRDEERRKAKRLAGLTELKHTLDAQVRDKWEHETVGMSELEATVNARLLESAKTFLGARE